MPEFVTSEVICLISCDFRLFQPGVSRNLHETFVSFS